MPGALLALFAVASAVSGRAQDVPADSPFLPAKAPADAHPAPAEPYQLSAIGVVEGKTFVSLYEAADKRSHWVAVGASLGEVKVVSCDVEAETAVIRVAGELKTLTLPKSTVTTAVSVALPSPSAVPGATGATPDQPAAPAAAGSDEDQAREARMLVSDLLEIGMQQRKAYEEAQKKKAEEPPAPPVPAPASN
ncbi:MAG TPA: hypothetical protein VG838_12150 [Opitutaceae bacterium]|nr:hypothetical protein [Opitutaceae bacterium]